jgi:hypothetical protein
MLWVAYFFLLVIVSHGPQQTGMPPMVTQQTHPVTQQAVQHSAQAWTTWQQVASPVVQLMHTPSVVFSTVQTQQHMLMLQTVCPFIITQQPTICPACIWHRFWTIETATLSVQQQWILTPLGHFSIFTVPRGTIIMLGTAGITPGMVGNVSGLPVIGVMPDMPIMPVRSVVMEWTMRNSFSPAA